MSSSTPFKNVTIAGGTGTLGYFISEAFLNDGSYNVKILRKKPVNENEKAKLLASKGAEILYVDYSDKDDLVNALKGTDVVVSVVSYDLTAANTNLYNIQSPLLAAAKEASVKRFIPSEFGIGADAGLHPITDDKAKFREELEKSGLEYTFIYVGLFQEFLTWFGFDVKNKKATFYGDKNSKLYTTSFSDVAKYTVESLKLPESRNATIRVSGAVLTLDEILKKFEEATGSKWEVIEEKDVRHRYRNKIEPVPSPFDDFKATVMETDFKKLDNDKFSFTPKPITDVINILVKA